MSKDPWTEVTLYELRGLLSYGEIHHLLWLVERAIEEADEDQDINGLVELNGLKSMLLATPMELGKTLGEWEQLLNENSNQGGSDG